MNYWVVYVNYRRKKPPVVRVMDKDGKLVKRKNIPKGLKKNIKKQTPKYRKMLKRYY